MTRDLAHQRPKAARAGDQAIRRQGAGGLPRQWLALGALIAVVVIAAAVYLTIGRGGGGMAVLQTDDFHALALSPDNPNVVFFGHHNGVMRSEDGGRTWRPLVERRNFDAMGLAVNPTNPRQLFLAGHDVFQTSNDGGASWQRVAHNLPGTDMHGFAASPDDPNRLFAFVVDHGLFASADGGQHWESLNDDMPDDVSALVASTSDLLFAGSLNQGIGKSSDGGKTWAGTSTGLGSPRVLTLAVDAANRASVYAGTADGLYRSDDAGQNWRRLTYPGKNAVAIAVSPGAPKVVLAIEGVQKGEGRVYRSEDGGATWSGQR